MASRSESSVRVEKMAKLLELRWRIDQQLATLSGAPPSDAAWVAWRQCKHARTNAMMPYERRAAKEPRKKDSGRAKPKRITSVVSGGLPSLGKRS